MSLPHWTWSALLGQLLVEVYLVLFAQEGQIDASAAFSVGQFPCACVGLHCRCPEGNHRTPLVHVFLVAYMLPGLLW